MQLFGRIKALCHENGISPTKLGLELGFSKDTINSWKSKSPSVDKVQMVADYFSVSTDYLLGRTDNPFPASSPFTDLTVEEVQAVKAFLEAFRREKG